MMYSLLRFFRSSKLGGKFLSWFRNVRLQYDIYLRDIEG
jgi:hypothetical protein